MKVVARRLAVKTSQSGIGLFRALVTWFERPGGLFRSINAMGEDAWPQTWL
jgi:hypothetical protein